MPEMSKYYKPTLPESLRVEIDKLFEEAGIDISHIRNSQKDTF